MQRNEFLKRLYDTDFQAALLANPQQALREVGVEVSASAEVKVVRNSKDSLNLVIPVANASDSELSDDELGQLSGGEIIFTAIVATLVVGGTVGAAALGGWGASNLIEEFG